MNVAGTFLRSYTSKDTCIEGMLTINIPMSQENQPLDIITVIDESQSMEFNMHIVKKVLHFLVEKATPNIQMGIVGFSTEAKMKCELSPITPTMHTFIETLQVDALTNLYDGLKLAKNMLHITGRKNAIPIIFLITDGVANVGVTNPVMIKKDLGLHIPSIFSLSIGSSCNHDLLASLAELTNAKTFKIETIDEIAASAGALLGSVLSLRIKNVKVVFPEDVYNISGLSNIGNMFAGEVIHLPFQSKSIHVGIVQVFSDDTICEQISLVAGGTTTSLEENQQVKVQILRCKVAQALLQDDRAQLLKLRDELNTFLTKDSLITLLLQRIDEGIIRKSTEEKRSINTLELIRQSSQSSNGDHPQCLPLMRFFSRDVTQYCQEDDTFPPFLPLQRY
jgi:uncharacterized protein YegL